MYGILSLIFFVQSITLWYNRCLSTCCKHEKSFPCVYIQYVNIHLPWTAEPVTLKFKRLPYFNPELWPSTRLCNRLQATTELTGTKVYNYKPLILGCNIFKALNFSHWICCKEHCYVFIVETWDCNVQKTCFELDHSLKQGILSFVHMALLKSEIKSIRICHPRVWQHVCEVMQWMLIVIGGMTGLEGDLNRLVEKFQRANIISAQLILAMLYSDLLSATKMVENKL